MKITSNNKGFTLIELLVVIAIISLLSSIVMSSLNSARAKANDAKRVSDLHNISSALELYYDKFGTYQVAGTGFSGCGCGFLSYENSFQYAKSVTRGLFEQGFLGSPLVGDPAPIDSGYMIYLCDAEQSYAISATKQNPKSGDISYIQTTCNGIGGNGTYSVYGKNYAVANKTY